MERSLCERGGSMAGCVSLLSAVETRTVEPEVPGEMLICGLSGKTLAEVFLVAAAAAAVVVVVVAAAAVFTGCFRWNSLFVVASSPLKKRGVLRDKDSASSMESKSSSRRRYAGFQPLRAV